MSWRCAVTSRARADRTRERIRRSPATKSIRSPAREARAVRSRAASMAESRRGTSSTRPAEVREVSRTITTRRSRSGCQVRTTTLVVRALARQSIDRTSSPRTYSRSESNSVPGPRTRIAARPSSSRSLASRLGRCLRESNGGSDRTTPGTSSVRWRAASPSGPRARTVTPSAGRSPAAPRAQGRGEDGAVAAGEVDPVPVAGRAGRRLPRVAHERADPALAGVGDPQHGGRGVAEPDGADRVPGEGQRRRLRREEQVDRPRAPPPRAATARPSRRSAGPRPAAAPGGAAAGRDR